MRRRKLSNDATQHRADRLKELRQQARERQYLRLKQYLADVSDPMPEPLIMTTSVSQFRNSTNPLTGPALRSKPKKTPYAIFTDTLSHFESLILTADEEILVGSDFVFNQNLASELGESRISLADSRWRLKARPQGTRASLNIGKNGSLTIVGWRNGRRLYTCKRNEHILPGSTLLDGIYSKPNFYIIDCLKWDSCAKVHLPAQLRDIQMADSYNALRLNEMRRPNNTQILKIELLPSYPLYRTLRLMNEDALMEDEDCVNDHTDPFQLRELDGFLIVDTESEYHLGYTDSIIHWRPEPPATNGGTRRCILFYEYSEGKAYTCDGVAVSFEPERAVMELKPECKRVRAVYQSANFDSEIGCVVLELVQAIEPVDIKAVDCASKILGPHDAPSITHLLATLQAAQQYDH